MNTYTSLNQRTNVWAIKKLLVNMQPYMHISNLAGQNATALPENTNSTVSFRRYLDFAVSVTPLTEAATTDNYQDLTKEDFTVSVAQYGAYTILSEKALLLMEDPVLEQTIARMGIQAGKTVETIGWNTLSTCTQVILAGGAASAAAVTSVFTIDTIRSAVSVLLNNNVEKIGEVVSATPGFNTSPVDAAYMALINPNQIKDLRNLNAAATGKSDDFLSKEKYPNQTSVMNGEIGKVEECRFLQSTLYAPSLGAGGATTAVRNTAGNADLYNIVIVGKDAFSSVAVKGVYSAEINVSADIATINNPYKSQRSISWKLWYAIVITNPRNLVRIVTACSK